nr:NADH:ubiquinone reductase (Na(+)-transporting) subunit B [uncultured Porphyromonas sp.]
MNALRKQLDKIKPAFMPGGRFSALESVFDGLETFLFVPNATSKRRGAHVHDAIDSKRTMSVVIFALLPALLFGMYNVGLQHNIALGQESSFWPTFFYGFLSVLPQIVVSYAVGLGIEFIIAQLKHEEIQEGFLVTGILIPMIIPVETPLWMIAVATAFAVVFAKEVFGGTGYNVFNVALITRAFLFFSYPAAMSGDNVWVRLSSTFGLGGEGKVVDGFTGATPLGQIAGGNVADIHNTLGNPLTDWDAFLGFLPGSVGEVSTLAILIGACILIFTGIASYKIMVSGVVGVIAMASLFNAFGTTAAMQTTALQHLLYGGFAFGIVFMATDPVTAARTETGKWIYGFLIGVMVVFIRVLNAGYAEGMMLAILLMNTFAPLIDYIVVERNVSKRQARLVAKNKN